MKFIKALSKISEGEIVSVGNRAKAADVKCCI